MKVTHKKSSDPGHVTDVRSVKVYKCSTCGAEHTTYASGASFCETCQKYMVEKSLIKESVVEEIKNRTIDPDTVTELGEDQTKKGREGRYDDGLVKRGVAGTVKSRSGHIPLRILVNMDKSAFIGGLVLLDFGGVRVTTSISELGGVFRPFDPTPKTIRKEDGTDIVQHPSPRRGTVSVGGISITGGATRQAFDQGLLTFECGKKKSVYSMYDIAQVLSLAL